MTVGELRRRCSAAELTGWFALWKLESDEAAASQTAARLAAEAEGALRARRQRR